MLNTKRLRWRLRIWRTHIVFLAIFVRYQLGCELEDGDEDTSTTSSEEDTLDCAGSSDTDDSAGGCNREDETSYDDQVDRSSGCAVDSTDEPEPSGCNNESSDNSGCSGSTNGRDPSTTPYDDDPYEVYEPGCAGCNNSHVIVDPTAGREVYVPLPPPPRYDTGVETDSGTPPDAAQSDDANSECAGAAACRTDDECSDDQSCQQGCCTNEECSPCTQAGADCACESDSSDELTCDLDSGLCVQRCAAGLWDAQLSPGCPSAEWCVSTENALDHYPGSFEDTQSNASLEADGTCRPDECSNVFSVALESSELDLGACAEASPDACPPGGCACLPGTDGRLECTAGGAGSLSSRCSSNAECQLGLVCQDGRCASLCSTSLDECPPPTTCVATFDTSLAVAPGVCALRCAGPGSEDCPAPTSCRPTSAGRDLVWMCSTDGEGALGARCRYSSQCGSGLFCASSTGTCETPCSPLDAQACPSGVCVDSGVEGVGFCAAECDLRDDSACAAAAHCRPVTVDGDPLSTTGTCVSTIGSSEACSPPGSGSMLCAPSDLCVGASESASCARTCAPHLGAGCDSNEWCDTRALVRGETAGHCVAGDPPAELFSGCDTLNSPCAEGGWCTQAGQGFRCLPYCRVGGTDCEDYADTSCTLIDSTSSAVAPWSGVCAPL